MSYSMLQLLLMDSAPKLVLTAGIFFTSFIQICTFKFYIQQPLGTQTVKVQLYLNKLPAWSEFNSLGGPNNFWQD